MQIFEVNGVKYTPIESESKPPKKMNKFLMKKIYMNK